MDDSDEKPYDRPGPQRLTEAELLAAVSEHAPASTSEVADEVDATREAAVDRLRDLLADGRLQRKRIAKVTVWYTACE